MKILQLGKFYPVLGGVEKVMFDLTVGLSETGLPEVRLSEVGLSEEGLSVKSFNGRSNKDGSAVFNIIIDITGKKQLEKVCSHFMNIKGVDEIERVTG